MAEIEELRKELKNNPKDAIRLKNLGYYYLQHGYFKEAQDQYHLAIVFNPRLASEIILDHEKILDNDSQNIPARLSLASLYLFLGNTDSALMEFEEALEADPKNTDIYNTLGSLYIKEDRIDDAISLLEKALEKGNDDILLIEKLAGAYLGKERLADAVSLYEKILSMDPASKRVLRILGDLYARMGKFDLAADRFSSMFTDDPEVSREVCGKLEDLLKMDDGSVHIREVLADIYSRCLRPDQAVQLMNKVLELDKDKLNAVIEKYRNMLYSYPKHLKISQALADALIAKGEYSEAVEIYDNLIKQDVNYLNQAIVGYKKILEVFPKQVLAHQYLGEAYLIKGGIEEAITEFRIALSLNPEILEYITKKCREILRAYPSNLSAHILLGEIYLSKDDARRAMEEAEQILGIDRNFASAHLLLGDAYTKLKLSKRAKESYQEAFMLDPFNSIVHQRYKEIKEKEAEKEIENLGKRIVEDPWRVSARLDLAKLFLVVGKREEALSELQTVTKDRSRAVFAYNLLGLLFKEEGKMDLAMVQFQKALENVPAELPELSKNIRFNMGLVSEAQGALKKAIKDFESILHEDVSFKNIQEKIKYLKNTSPKALRYKILLMVIRDFGEKNTLGIWGREARIKSAERKEEEIKISFGQSRLSYGFEYFTKGMFKNAEEEFELAVQLDASFAPAINNLGATFLHERRFDEAEARFTQAVKLDPECAIYHNNLGIAYYFKGNLLEAQNEFEKAKALDAELSAPLLNLGDLYYVLGKTKDAIESYQAIKEIDVLRELAEKRLQYKLPSKL